MTRSAVRWSTVLRDQIDLQISRGSSAQAIHAAVAQKSRLIRDTAIQQGRASPVYVTKVDGRRGATEETVQLAGGTITYVFSQLAQAANWALDECRKRSPVRSGAFRKSWAVLVDGKLWDAAPATIPMGTEVWIVNTMPYARKIEVGGQKIKVDPKIVEAVRQIVPRRFSGIMAQRAFKPLAGGRDARGGPVPYILKGSGIASGLSWTRKEGWTRKHASYVSNRSDRQPGEQVLYGPKDRTFSLLENRYFMRQSLEPRGVTNTYSPCSSDSLYCRSLGLAFLIATSDSMIPPMAESIPPTMPPNAWDWMARHETGCNAMT